MWEIDEGDLSRFRCHVSHGSGRMALDENLRRLPASAPRWRGNYTIRQKILVIGCLLRAGRKAESERESEIIRNSTRLHDVKLTRGATFFDPLGARTGQGAPWR
jgi:hypothetical protein